MNFKYRWSILLAAIINHLWSLFSPVQCLDTVNNKLATFFAQELISKYTSNRTLNTNQFQLLLESIHRRELDATTHTNDVNKFSTNCSSQNLEEKLCNLSSHCLNAATAPSWLPYLGSEVTPDDIVFLSPLILYQIDTSICSQKVKKIERKPSSLEVWGYGFLFVTLISLCSLIGVIFIPLMGKNLYNRLLMYLIGLAVGSLCGSAIFHLIPQAFQLINGDNHEYLWRAVVVVGGIYLFFITERIMKIIMDNKKRNKAHLKKEFSETNTLSDLNSESRSSSSIRVIENGQLCQRDSHTVLNSNHNEDEVHASCKHDHIEFKTGDNVVATVAWMIVFGDGLHNFIDGLSIGAAFSESVLSGISISTAVMCEELPHELGDFAILLNSGMTTRQAMMYNFLSACTCYLGLITGILLGELTASSTYIFGLAAGMFLYISLVDMMPEMNNAAENASKASTKKGLIILFIQSLGYVTGFGAMFVLSLYGGSISFG